MKKRILKILLFTIINIVYLPHSAFAIFDNNICSFNEKKLNNKDASIHLLKKKQNKINEISVDFLKPDAYLKKIIKLKSEYNRIPKFYKNYSKVKIKVSYNNITCNYSGEARIHGSTIGNIHPDLMISSLRVRILNGHINHIKEFSLILGDNKDLINEVFVSSLFRELKFLSPYKFIANVKINNSKNLKLLFVESPSLEMSKNQNRNNGVFISANRNNWSKPKLNYQNRRSIVLSRLKNIDGIELENKSVLLDALDKINYIYLNSLGLGNGKTCCANIKKNDLVKKNYSNGEIFLRYENLKSHKDYYNKILSYEHLLYSVNGFHGLELEDRMFFYNPMTDFIEPVYNELQPYDLLEYPIIGFKKKSDANYPNLSFSHKLIKEDLTMSLKKINIENFNKSINNKGLNFNIELTKTILNKILNSIINYEDYEDVIYDNKFTPNYFNNHFENNLNFELAFNGTNNYFEICDINLSKCKKKKFKNETFFKLLNDKFIYSEDVGKNITYVRLSKDSYLNNFPPINKGIFSLKYLDLNGLSFFYNFNRDKINFNKEKKTLSLNLMSKYDKIIIYKNKIKGWEINIKGPNTLEKIDFKRDKYMLGGCINIVESEIISLNLNILNANCAKAVEILNSNGYINNINIKNTSFDALDSEMSKLTIESINIENVNGDCVGFKRGIFNIKNVQLKNCSDKGISYGEHSDGIIHRANVENSKVGLYVKDSSVLNVEKFVSLNNQYCLMLINLKKNYYGSILNIKENHLQCNKNEIFFDKFSQFNLLQ